MKHKLRSRRGVTLSEMLVAVLILGLMTLAVAAGMTSALNVHQKATTLSKSSVLASTLSQALCDELRYARDIQANPDGTLKTYTSAFYGTKAALGVNADGHLTVSGNALVGSGAYAEMTASANVSFKNARFDVALSLQKGGKEIRALSFAVRPLNSP